VNFSFGPARNHAVNILEILTDRFVRRVEASHYSLSIWGGLRDHVIRHSAVYFDAIVAIFYLLGVWEHLPYAGGHIYSDLDVVFPGRFCPTVLSHNAFPCYLGIPYVNVFVEYPVLTGFFMWSMGLLAKIFSLWPLQSYINNYYGYTAILLLIPTALLISDTLKIAEILGVRQKHKRVTLFLVATPSFVFMLLLNWYIIGVWLTTFAIRKFLQGSRWTSGILIGLSAAANLVTAVPALGMLFGARSWREVLQFLFGIAISLGAIYGALTVLNSFPHSYLTTQTNAQSHGVFINYPFLFPNTSFISNFLSYNYNWYIEGSWMLAVMTNLNPLRHIIFPVLFFTLCCVITFVGYKRYWFAVNSDLDRAHFVLTMSWMFTFAFLFSTYVCTPQMNLILLPFFVLIPIVRYYPEFLAFDIVNALVIVWGFSQPLQFLGITIPTPVQFGPVWESPIQFLAVVRSLWIGKFLIVDGLFFPHRFSSTQLDATPFTKP
jgi:hypothetical protein